MYNNCDKLPWLCSLKFIHPLFSLPHSFIMNSSFLKHKILIIRCCAQRRLMRPFLYDRLIDWSGEPRSHVETTGQNISSVLGISSTLQNLPFRVLGLTLISEYALISKVRFQLSRNVRDKKYRMVHNSFSLNALQRLKDKQRLSYIITILLF